MTLLRAEWRGNGERKRKRLAEQQRPGQSGRERERERTRRMSDGAGVWESEWVRGRMERQPIKELQIRHEEEKQSPTRICGPSPRGAGHQ
ncbi:hypothetical protein F2P81_018937 [Scophthalmus maximus]|uniref:Uncharacterized protein n=1 Tax=Scophthalmus maximus TaxID=52904 RepID=A0A6A4SHH6_SCOMX|nr:hypothetical protein F2P81_018937 [Scophthalmus maximus]